MKAQQSKAQMQLLRELHESGAPITCELAICQGSISGAHRMAAAVGLIERGKVIVLDQRYETADNDAVGRIELRSVTIGLPPGYSIRVHDGLVIRRHWPTGSRVALKNDPGRSGVVVQADIISPARAHYVIEMDDGRTFEAGQIAELVAENVGTARVQSPAE